MKIEYMKRIMYTNGFIYSFTSDSLKLAGFLVSGDYWKSGRVTSRVWERAEDARPARSSPALFFDRPNLKRAWNPLTSKEREEENYDSSRAYRPKLTSETTPHNRAQNRQLTDK